MRCTCRGMMEARTFARVGVDEHQTHVRLARDGLDLDIVKVVQHAVDWNIDVGRIHVGLYGGERVDKVRELASRGGGGGGQQETTGHLETNIGSAGAPAHGECTFIAATTVDR